MTLSTKDLTRLALHTRQHGTSEGFVPTEPKKRRRNEEFSLQCALVTWWASACESFGIPEMLLWHTPNSAVYGGSKAQREKMGAMLKRLGQRSGVPDVFVAVGRYDQKYDMHYHGLFIELKSLGGIVSPEQKAMLAQLERHGYRTAVCRTLEDAQRVITQYLSNT